MRRVAILGGARIPFARANGAYAEASNQDMLTAAFQRSSRNSNLKGEKIGEVAAGAVIKHSRDWNLARESTLGAGIHPTTPAYDLQRACGTSLSAAAQLGNRIALGEIDSAIAGGADSTSDIPLGFGSGSCNRSFSKSARARSFGAAAVALAEVPVEEPEAGDAAHRRAAHRPVDGRALRGDGEGVEDRAARAGRARAGQPPGTPRRRGRRASSTTWSFHSWKIKKQTTTCAAIPRWRSSAR